MEILKVNKGSIVNQLVDVLRKEIIEGILKPKEKISELYIAKRFKVSRAPIRECFRILEAANLIKIVPRKGYFVSDINIDDIKQLYLIRPMLEGEAARLACMNITENDLVYLSKIINKMGKAVEKKNYNVYLQLNKEFCEAIINIAGNKFLKKILKILEDQSLRYRFFALASLGRIKQSYKNHINLLNALREKNEKKVQRLRYKNIKDVGKNVVNSLSLTK